MEFTPMPKMARLSREVICTEKLDGSNASIFVQPLDNEGAGKLAVLNKEPFLLRAGSRTRWITPEDDNYGFARWVYDNADELVKLGPGHHFGEWWGQGINRGYGLGDRRFSLFNVDRWGELITGGTLRPACCHVVPVLHRGGMNPQFIDLVLAKLQSEGSVAAPGFMDPEGIVVFHTAANVLFKKTIKGDEAGKGYEGHVKKVRAPKEPRDYDRGGRRVALTPGWRGVERRSHRIPKEAI